jgi:hypothetical protein
VIPCGRSCRWRPRYGRSPGRFRGPSSSTHRPRTLYRIWPVSMVPHDHRGLGGTISGFRRCLDTGFPGEREIDRQQVVVPIRGSRYGHGLCIAGSLVREWLGGALDTMLIWQHFCVGAGRTITSIGCASTDLHGASLEVLGRHACSLSGCHTNDHLARPQPQPMRVAR